MLAFACANADATLLDSTPLLLGVAALGGPVLFLAIVVLAALGTGGTGSGVDGNRSAGAPSRFAPPSVSRFSTSSPR